MDTTAHSQGLLVCQGLYSVSLSVTLYILAPAERLVSKQGSRFIHFLTSTAGLGHLVDSLSAEAPLMVLQGQSRGLCMARGLDCFMDRLFCFQCGCQEGNSLQLPCVAGPQSSTKGMSRFAVLISHSGLVLPLSV